jgi:integrase
VTSIRKRVWKAPSGESKMAWQVDYADSRGRQRKHFPSKKAADDFRVVVEGQMRAGTYRPGADKVTVKEVCEAFLEHCEGRQCRDERMTRKMLVVYRGHVQNHILHPDRGVGGSKLSQLTARSIGEFRDRMRASGVTVPTTRKVLATLHGVLAHAISQDWVATNAAHGTRVIGPRNEGSKKIMPPSKAQLQAVLELADPDLRLKLLFAASTGVRAGEQWALRWKHVDFGIGAVRVECRVDVYGEEGPPKSAAGVRSVPMSSQLVAQLKAWKLRSKFKSDEDLIFPNGAGNYLGHDHLISRRFLPLFDKAEVPRFTWHGLRHFAISCWIEARLAPKTVQTFAGHASLQITMDRYGHLFPSDDHKRAMDAIAVGLFT